MIDDALVHRLVAAQFPRWAGLAVRPVLAGGWDNRTFHLGDRMLVRMPSADCYAGQVAKEHKWLPRLAPLLPLQVPMPLALGMPAEGYPWTWSIYGWIDGDSAAAATTRIADRCGFAASLARFLVALQRIDTSDGPAPGAHNFHRGGNLMAYDADTRRAIATLGSKVDETAATEVWEAALETRWLGPATWVHGDISAGNLLVRDGRLNAVIDFGMLAVGDPACDLAIAWTRFEREDRDIFRSTMDLDAGTWRRGRAWALWKALIVAADVVQTNAAEAARPWRAIEEVLADHQAQ